MSEKKVWDFKIPSELNGKRIDSAIVVLTSGELTRSRIKKLIEDGYVEVEGKTVKPSFRLISGQTVHVVVPYVSSSLEITPQDIKLDILYEDEDIIVINKPSGMVVHPGAGNPDGTMVNALMFHCKSLSCGDPLRPGIVHRLDKGTSGLVIAAKNEKSHTILSSMFQKKKVHREYKALVYGCPPSSGILDTFYGRHKGDRKKFSGKVSKGKRAITRFENLKFYRRSGISLIRAVLDTGRTHQIRVHMSEAGWPVVGDPVYGRKRKTPDYISGILKHVDHPLLHSEKIKFIHPVKRCQMEFIQEPEPVFLNLIKIMEENE